MPEINLPRNFAENPSAAFNAGNLIISYMVHPNDEQKRDELLRLSNLDLKQRLRDVPISKVFTEKMPILSQNPSLAKALRDDGIETLVSPYLILPENPEKFLLNINANAAMRAMFEPHVQLSWGTVYAILHTMMRIDRYLPQIKSGASVSKAVVFLEKTGKTNIKGNRADMMKAWREYKSIAHYLFPFFFMYAHPDRKDFCHLYTESGITGFIVLAGNVQKWMLSQKPAHSRQDKLFNKKDLWLIPKRYDIQDFPFKVTPFTEAELAVIKDYKRF